MRQTGTGRTQPQPAGSPELLEGLAGLPGAETPEREITYAFAHVRWSETRLWMALLMGATMAVIMLSFMLNMYANKTLNLAIYAGSLLVFALTLWLMRSQATIDDQDYMRAMIPHHSIAIMTSERAQISDPRVRELADEIISAQRREIAEMEYLIGDLQKQARGVDEESSSTGR